MWGTYFFIMSFWFKIIKIKAGTMKIQFIVKVKTMQIKAIIEYIITFLFVM